jgi:uncharacterized protein (TIGR02996 family)
MTDGYALLRAIEANSDEDTPRLASADWLQGTRAIGVVPGARLDEDGRLRRN